MNRTRLRARTAATAVVLLLVAGRVLPAQDLIDRIVARVDGVTITLTDVRMALALGIVTPTAGEDPVAAGTQQLVDRQLITAEVQRFPPPEPAADAVDGEVARLTAGASGGLAAVERATGLTAQRLRLLARENLRTVGYLDQRFGAAAAVDEREAAEYYRTHPDEFTVGGQLQPFEDVVATAQARAAVRRRQAAIETWVRGLRMRADVAINAPGPRR